MAKVPAFYSALQTDRRVYHDDTSARRGTTSRLAIGDLGLTDVRSASTARG